MRRIIVAPSILAADFSRLGEEIHRVEAAGADWIHCDIMDGHFVDNISFGPEMVGIVRGLTSLPLDVHLMIERADHYVPRFIKAGANSITVHVEPAAKHDVASTLQRIRESVSRQDRHLADHDCASRIRRSIISSRSNGKSEACSEVEQIT
jgi:ribulose-phosphate 3-epimerase